MHYLGNIIYLNEHSGQLRQVEVHILVGEAEQLVGEVALDARLLGVEEIADGHVHVKQFALEQAQQEVLGAGRLSSRRLEHKLYYK